MTDKKISELNAATTLGDSDLLAVVQDGETKKAAATVLRDFATILADQQLLGGIEYATDIALQSVRELYGTGTPGTRHDQAIESAINAIAALYDLAGVTARMATQNARLRAAPASSSAAGTQGEWAWDSNYIYVCTALNTWKRVAISTW